MSECTTVLTYHVCNFESSICTSTQEMSTILVELDRPDCLLVDPELFSQLIGMIGVLENVDLA